MFHRLIECLKPRPMQPGGHPTIPAGKIIAKPRADGGYSLSIYSGILMGWRYAGQVEPGEDVQAAMRNVARPVLTFVPSDDKPTKVCIEDTRILSVGGSECH